MKQFLYLIIGIGCLLIMIIVNSCGTRHEPRIVDKRVNVESTKQYQKYDSIAWLEGDTIGVEYSKYGKVIIKRIPYKNIMERMKRLENLIHSQKDSIELLKTENQICRKLIDYQKEEIKRLSDEN